MSLDLTLRFFQFWYIKKRNDSDSITMQHSDGHVKRLEFVAQGWRDCTINRLQTDIDFQSERLQLEEAYARDLLSVLEMAEGLDAASPDGSFRMQYLLLERMLYSLYESMNLRREQIRAYSKDITFFSGV
tara:strand:+ start:8073 stop:8462 length:390 start_codon:yes stop_codon:yes gene_type:complete